MADVHTEVIRSKNMRSIKSEDTKPEIQIRKALYAKGYRYRLHYKKLPGKPDLYLSKYRSAIWINGCFWHAHGCSLFKVPRTRAAFWVEKLNRNVERDRINIQKTLELKYRVLVIWECALKGKNKLPSELLPMLIGTWLHSESILGYIDTNGMTCLEDTDINNLNGCVGQSI